MILDTVSGLALYYCSLIILPCKRFADMFVGTRYLRLFVCLFSRTYM